MISQDKYVKLVSDVLNRNIEDNISQKKAVLAGLNENQYIVAGPGSGKTTVLVLKILKYYFVDGISLDNIVVTTFTKKAARELKERTILWAKKLFKALDIDFDNNFNEMLIGTLDSIAEEFVCDADQYDVIDNFTSSALMMQLLLDSERNTDKKLKQFFKELKNNRGGVNTSEINNMIQSIRERIYYDMVDYESLKHDETKVNVLFDIIDDYNLQLKNRNILDYPLLEYLFYEKLSDEHITKLDKLQVLLIDEYQDTNYLQEQIYFQMAKYTISNKGNITVVGDDDQSLYRFRGATIELFTDYVNRIRDKLDVTVDTVYLQKNYRSTSNIIGFTNDFIHIDKKYLANRTSNKPLIVPDCSTIEGVPVMGLFRNNMAQLITDLSNLIYGLKTGNIKRVIVGTKNYDLSLNDSNPSIAVLTNSPKEVSAFNKKKLPYYIRESLSFKDENIVVFNPRGQSIESTDIVSLMCGLILLTIDPKNTTEKSLDNIPPHTKKVLKLWRIYANEYLKSQQKDVTVLEDDFVDMDYLLKDINKECRSLLKESTENIIYHDIIVNTITQTNNAITYDGTLSAKQIFWHILVPIASGAIDVDDDMFDISLEENVNIMSIHQAKGLEFDIVIVDVGSDIYNNSSSSAFKRFPKNGGKTYNIEKYLSNYSKLSKNYEANRGIDDAFNDLIRRYFVAYTRAKKVLILVGLNSMRYGYKGDFQNNIEIPNVATGWSRDKVWHWQNLDNLLNI